MYQRLFSKAFQATKEELPFEPFWVQQRWLIEEKMNLPFLGQESRSIFRMTMASSRFTRPISNPHSNDIFVLCSKFEQRPYFSSLKSPACSFLALTTLQNHHLASSTLLLEPVDRRKSLLPIPAPRMMKLPEAQTPADDFLRFVFIFILFALA